jgi:uncharacterized protein (TIGR03437 family)
VLTNASGTATCNLIFAGPPGPGQFSLLVGGQYTFPSSGGFGITVTAGAPATIMIISGNNQSANPGTALPAPLVAQITDQAGNPLPGTPVSWSVVQGSATVNPQTGTADSNGRVQTSVTLGAGNTPVQVRVQSNNNPATAAVFTASVNAVITGMSKVSGDNQNTPVNTAFSQPLIVQVNNQTQPAPGITVNFVVTSGSATLGSASATTNGAGQAQTTVRAGAAAGPVIVTATAGSVNVAFTLTVSPPAPTLSQNSFYNAAGFQQGFLSPCSLATIIAPGLAPGIQGGVVPAIFGPLPYVVANVSVQFGNSFAPIYSVINSYSPGQDAVTVQVPCELTPGTVPVTVKVGGGATTVNVQVLSVSPGVFETVMSDKTKRAVLTRPDGSFVQLENPARRGELIRAYVTGLGPVSPAVGTNQIGVLDTDMTVSGTVIVGVNNSGVRVVGAKYAPNLIGVYVVEFQVASDSATGSNLPFAVAIQQGDNFVFGNGSLIPIQ